MKFEQFGAAELQRRFGGTYVFNYKLGRACRILEFSSGAREVVFQYRANDSQKASFNQEEWFLALPTLGFIPTNGHCLYIQRIPRRQYSYGFTNSQVRTKPIGLSILEMLPISSLRAPSILQWDILDILLNPDTSQRYSSVHEAMAKLDSKKYLSVPLSEHWCLTSHPISTYPLLYNGQVGQPIGRLAAEDLIEMPSNNLFMYEEISQLFNFEVNVI